MRDLLRSPRHHKAAALRSSLRSEIDDPVRCLNDVEMMLDNDHRVSKVCQPAENVQKLFNIIEMQTSGGFVENIKSFSRGAPAQFYCQFNPLSVTAGQCGCRLAKTDVTQSNVDQCLLFGMDLGNVTHHPQCICNCGIEQ